MRFVSRLVVPAAVLVVGCEDPPAQGPNEWTYQNGYAQSARPHLNYDRGYPERTTDPSPSVTYTPLAPRTPEATAVDPSQTPPTQIQTTPVPLGVAQPTAAPPATATPAPAPTLATPGRTAAECSSDAHCGLSRCNLTYGRCAYPCRSDADCQQGNVCTAGGACLPRTTSGLSI